jgi:hypothetical protein
MGAMVATVKASLAHVHRTFPLLQRAEVVSDAMEAVQQYTAALAFMLPPDYPSTSYHALWALSFQAATSVPPPEGFRAAVELAPPLHNAADVVR